tara:strand:+ start:1018 stop:1191 length:174 start_codon:yes stop_codon:yes gene_type:complete
VKKVIIFTALVFASGSGIYFANHFLSNHTNKSLECPCTPDCQPGDAWCTCTKDSCEK